MCLAAVDHGDKLPGALLVGEGAGCSLQVQLACLPGSRVAPLPTVPGEFGPSRDGSFPVDLRHKMNSPLSISCRSSGQRTSPGQPSHPAGAWVRSRVPWRGLAPGRILGRTRERLGDFSPEIQTIGQSVLDRFRSSDVKKKSQKIQCES